MTALIYGAAVALFVWRMSRPQRMSVARLFIMPIVLVAVTVFSIWGSQTTSPSPAWEIAAVLAVGIACGVPLGMLRGRHSEVKATSKRGVMFVHSSPAIVVVWLAVFLVRAGLRYFMGGSATGAGVIGDGLLAFAVAALVTSYYAIYTKYKNLLASSPAAA